MIIDDYRWYNLCDSLCDNLCDNLWEGDFELISFRVHHSCGSLFNKKKTVATVQQIADFLISIHFGGEIKYHFPIEPQPWPSPKPSSNITITIHQPFTMVIDPWSMSSWDCHKIQPRIGWFIKSKRWLHCWARSFFRNIQGGAPPVINCL